MHSYRAHDTLRVRGGGRAFVLFTDTREVYEGLPLPLVQVPAPFDLHACVGVMWPSGAGESVCGAPRMDRYFFDPTLDRLRMSFTIREVVGDGGGKWTVDLDVRGRGPRRGEPRIVRRAAVDSAGVSVLAGAAGAERRFAVTRGIIRTPEGRHAVVRTAVGRRDVLSRRI